MRRNAHIQLLTKGCHLLFIAALALTLAAVPARVARAATLNVSIADPKCDDKAGAPFCTIPAAIGAAAAGDTIVVAGGRYPGRLTIAKNLVLSGAGADTTILDGLNDGTVISISAETTVGISGVTIQHGNAGTSAGIDNNGSLNLSNSVVADNHAAFDGAGIFSSGLLIVSDSTITNNSVDDDGGGIENTGSMTLIDSTVSDNQAGSTGAGIANSGVLNVTNSTISGNRAAGNGGGIINSGAVALNNATIVGNSSGGESAGGGIFHSGNSAILRNSILAANRASASPDCFGTLASQGFNLLGSNSGCAFKATAGDKVGNIEVPIDPRLGALQNNGGPTSTHALLAGSPAIDAGNPAAPGGEGAACAAADQRGIARPQGAACDIGAYEASAAPRRVRLVFTVQPAGGLLGTPFSAQVTTKDQAGNLVDFDGAVTLSATNIVGVRGTISLSGTTTVEAVDGVAEFSGLSIGPAGSGYQLIASADGLVSAASALFNITALPPAEYPAPEVEVNGTIDQANPLIFEPSGHAARVGVISTTEVISPDLDVYSFAVRPGATATISLTDLPADYDVMLLADPSVPILDSDNIDLSDIADLGKGAIGKGAIGKGAIGKGAIGKGAIGKGAIGDYITDYSANPGTQDERIDAFLSQGGRYFIVVYGVTEQDFNLTSRYRLDVSVTDGSLVLPSIRARPITPPFNAAPDTAVRTIYLYASARMHDLYGGADEAPSLAALASALAPSSLVMQASADGARGKGVSIDLSSPTLQISDTDNLEALYRQWDEDPTQPLLANEVALQVRYALGYALDNVYPNATDIVIVGDDQAIPFFRVPDENTFAPERGYPRTLPPTTLLEDSPLYGSLFYSFIQTDNFYADRRPTPWRGRALYLPDLGIGRLVERPSDIMHYLDGYLASDKYTVDASQPDGAVLVTGYDFLTDQADAIIDQYGAYGFSEQGTLGTSPTLRPLVNDRWDVDQFADAWFDGQLPQLVDGYDGPHTPYHLMVLNGHFSHYNTIPAVFSDTGTLAQTFLAQRIMTPTASLDERAYFKIDGAPTLVYSVGCQSGLNAPDAAFDPQSPLYRADFAQAVLKQGGNWIGNTGFGIGDTETIGYSERLSTKLTEALGRRIADASDHYIGAPIGEALARAKRQYILTNGPAGFSVYDEKVLTEMTMYGLPFIRVKVPHPTPLPPPPASIPASIRAGLPGANGIFTRVISMTNSFAPLGAGDLVPRVTSVVEDSFRPGEVLSATVDVQMAPGRPVLPLLTYDLTLQENPDAPQPGAAAGAPIARGLRLLSALTPTELDKFKPHITAPTTDENRLQGDAGLRVTGLWTPDVPFAVQRISEQAPGVGTQFEDTLRVIPAQFRARNAETGRLRLFEQMVFEVVYIDPHTAPASVREQNTRPLFSRFKVSLPDQGPDRGRVVLKATVQGGDGGIEAVGATYTTDGVHWRRAALAPHKPYRYRVRVDAPAGHLIAYAFFDALDPAGNLSVATPGRDRRRQAHHGQASSAGQEDEDDGGFADLDDLYDE
jgi:hypothetical protein